MYCLGEERDPSLFKNCLIPNEPGINLGDQKKACVACLRRVLTQGDTAIERVSELEANLYEARTDADTNNVSGIPNDRAVEKRIKQAIDDKEDFGVILYDVEDFKKFNKVSHAVGDRVLRCVGQTLQTVSRKIDMAAHLHGDEFLVFVPLIGSHDLSLDNESRIFGANTRITTSLKQEPAFTQLESLYGSIDVHSLPVLHEQGTSFETFKEQYLAIVKPSGIDQ